MKSASIAEIRRELREKTNQELIDYCLKLSRFKQDNKSMLSYLLFESEDEEAYKTAIKEDLEVQFSEINTSSIYYAKKSLRKILRELKKQIRYSGLKQTEVELLVFYCQQLVQLPIHLNHSRVLMNLFRVQMARIEKSLGQLEEDLQFDYQSDIEALKNHLGN